MFDELTKRQWPLVVRVRSGVLHISRHNSGAGKVRTECGRDIHYVGTYSGTPDQLRDADKNRVVESKYDFEKEQRICSRCGSPEEFAAALEDYNELHGAFMKVLREKQEYVDSQLNAVNKGMSDTIAELLKTGLGDAVQDISQSGCGIQFNLKLPAGTLIQMELVPTDDQAKELDRAWKAKAAEDFEKEQEDVQGKA